MNMQTNKKQKIVLLERQLLENAGGLEGFMQLKREIEFSLKSKKELHDMLDSSEPSKKVIAGEIEAQEIMMAQIEDSMESHNMSIVLIVRELKNLKRK